MATARTGTLEGEKTPLRDASSRRYWRGKVTLQDGTKARVDIPVPKCYSATAARLHVEWAQAEEDTHHTIDNAKVAKHATAAPAIATGEADRWFDAWIASRKARGLSSTADNEGHFRLHIRPALGGKHVRDWTSDDLRAVVAALDAKIAAGEISPKSASNIYGTATKMVSDACKSKVAALRVRSDNPAKDVTGPDAGEERAKQFLYPSEFLRLVSCEGVPLRWRRAIALAVYLFPRAGELRALKWDAVDLEHDTVHVHESFERRSRLVTSTKSGKGSPSLSSRRSSRCCGRCTRRQTARATWRRSRTAWPRACGSGWRLRG